MASASPEVPVAGADYLTIAQQPLSAGAGKIEVTEFFWYGCSHCGALEPSLEAWLKTQGKDVVFKRVPVTFARRFEPHTRMFIALSTLGKEAALTPKVFHEIQVKRNPLLTKDAQAEFFAQFGIDKTAYGNAYDAAGEPAMMRKESAVEIANKTWQRYKIDGAPTLVIQGQYLVSPTTSGQAMRKAGVPVTTEQQIVDAMLKTADSIIRRIRVKTL